jgi:hypothetical protein
MAVKVEDVNDNDIDDSEEDDNMMTTVTRRRTCKRRRAGPEKRRTIEDVGKENGVEEGEGNDSLIAKIGVVVVVLLTILLIAVISKIKIKLLVLIIIVYNAAAVVAAIRGIVVRLSVMVDGCSNDCDYWAGSVDETVDVAGDSIVKKSYQRNHLFFGRKKKVSIRCWIRSRR